MSRIAVIGGLRSPFARAGTSFKGFSARDLAVHAVDGLLARLAIAPETVETLVFGIVTPEPRLYHFAREVVFASSLPASVRALTVVDNCITGTSAIATLADAIASGRADIGICGGVESMSNPPVMFSRRASRIFIDVVTARGWGARLRAGAMLRPWHFLPESPAVVEPSTGLSMGEHCELMVKAWKVDRDTQDEIALRSHRKAAQATADGRLTDEIEPLDGVDHDLLVRADASIEALANLAPVFDRAPTGTITAGNSSALTDGAAAVLLMSEKRAVAEGREPLAYINASLEVAIDPGDGLLMGPGVAVPRMLRETGLTLEDMDLVEIHEAFAGQVECNLRAWEQGWMEPAIGRVDPERLNPLGGSIAIGHPFAATGARIVTSVANELCRRSARYGLISICGAGATAAAMVLERP